MDATREELALDAAERATEDREAAALREARDARVADRDRRASARECGEAAAKAVSDVSWNTEARRAFIEALLRDHRSAQQSTARAFLEFFEGLGAARAAGMFDPRNEAACDLGRAISDLPARVKALPRV